MAHHSPENRPQQGPSPEDQDPWYAEGLRFTCSACGNCCTGAPGFVWVSDEEIEQLAAWLAIDRAAFQHKFVRRVGQRQSLVEHANGDCVFFDPQTRRCRVYRLRPKQCRTWPFWDANLRQPDAWAATCQVCPGAGTGELVPLEQIESQRREISI